jgi:hypothetical protein
MISRRHFIAALAATVAAATRPALAAQPSNIDVYLDPT